MIFNNHAIIGADISFYQGYPPHFPTVDFRKMRDYGFDFVIIKAGQRSYEDPAFVYNWKAAKGILPRSSYWYYDNRYSAIAQAKKYWDTIKHDLEGICWLDLEDRNIGDYTGWYFWYDFLATFKLLSGLPDERIGIYTAFYYWLDGMARANLSQREYFKKHPLWLANYGNKYSNPLYPEFENIVVPRPWDDADCLILQTGTPIIGIESGVASYEIDYNFFNGDRDKFNSVFKQVADVNIFIRSA